MSRDKLKIFCLFGFFIIFNFKIYTQNSSDKKTVINLFKIDENSGLKSKYITNSVEGEILSLNSNELQRILKSDLNTFTLKLPLEGEILNLEMRKSSFIVEGAIGKTMHSKLEADLSSRGLHYWGKIYGQDSEASMIAFSFYDDKVLGIFSSDVGDYSLNKLKEEGSNAYVLYKYDRKVQDFECATDEESFRNNTRESINVNMRNTNISTLDYPIHISMNANNCIINNPFMGDGSITDTIDYILNHFNYYSLIFANEEISIKISEIVLEDTVPNGTGEVACLWGVNASTDFFGPGMTPAGNCPPGTTTDYLQQFQDELGSSYVGDYAYMYVGGSCHAQGRAASIGSYCDRKSEYRMGVGRGPIALPNGYELPDFFNMLNVFPHELGHLLGANHTYCSSSLAYNIMLSGGGSCYGVDFNFRRGFGVLRGNDIRNNILNNLNCFTESNFCEQDNLYIFHRIEDEGNIDYSALYKATNIIADNVILNNSEALYTAESAIELLPGFEVEENSEFEARIEDCALSSNRSFIKEENFIETDKFLVVPTAIENIVFMENKNKLGEQISMVKIYNLFGKEVFKDDKIKSRSISFDLSSLSEGFYILKIFGYDGQTLHTQKIIKK